MKLLQLSKNKISFQYKNNEPKKLIKIKINKNNHDDNFKFQQI